MPVEFGPVAALHRCRPSRSLTQWRSPRPRRLKPPSTVGGKGRSGWTHPGQGEHGANSDESYRHRRPTGEGHQDGPSRSRLQSVALAARRPVKARMGTARHYQAPATRARRERLGRTRVADSPTEPRVRLDLASAAGKSGRYTLQPGQAVGRDLSRLLLSARDFTGSRASVGSRRHGSRACGA